MVAVSVNTPVAVEDPGLLIGVGEGSVGANHPKAIPPPELADKDIVPVLQIAVNVATGPTVFEVMVTGTVVVHRLNVLVKTTE